MDNVKILCNCVTRWYPKVLEIPVP